VAFPSQSIAVAGSILQMLLARAQLFIVTIRFYPTCILNKLLEVVTICFKTHLALV
jgi:hypothetical protein